MAKYGEQTFELIFRYIKKLKDAQIEEGYEPRRVFVDKYLRKSDTSNARKIRKMLLEKVDKKSIAHILIIGNDDIIPFFRVENLVDPLEDPDRIIYSDMLYGCEDHDDDYFDFVPRISIGRLPDGGANEPGFLVRQLRCAAKHRTIVIHEKANNFFGYFADNFYHFLKPVLEPMGKFDGCLVSPPVDMHSVRIPAHPIDWLFILLHGSDTVKYWYGESRDGSAYPRALAPENIREMTTMSNAFGYALPCYGGYILEKTTKDSNALALLDTGVENLICSSMLVWAGINRLSMEVSYGTRLCQLFYSGRALCKTVGNYFAAVKKKFVEDMANNANIQGETYVNICLKTLMEFNLYGDPSVKIRFVSKM